jgi:hypothetical protein
MIAAIATVSPGSRGRRGRQGRGGGDATPGPEGAAGTGAVPVIQSNRDPETLQGIPKTPDSGVNIPAAQGASSGDSALSAPPGRRRPAASLQRLDSGADLRRCLQRD